jgi:hypothetical protein
MRVFCIPWLSPASQKGYAYQHNYMSITYVKPDMDKGGEIIAEQAVFNNVLKLQTYF